MYSLEDGAFLIRLARKAIETYLESGKVISPPRDAPEKLKQKAGVFVTLETYPEKDLRGCIGYAEPIFPLAEAVVKAAISAATEDPRFPPALLGEMDSTLVEVTILTPPELIAARHPKEYLSAIEIGKDGLIVERGLNRGLLLPQVAVEEKWGREEFLAYTCMKAGLLSDAWCDPATRVYKFQGRVFLETEPKGKVVEKKLKACEK